MEKDILVNLKKNELIALEESMLCKLNYYNEIILNQEEYKKEYINYIKTESIEYQEILYKIQSVLNPYLV